MNGISLCSDVGGLELGLHRVIPGYRTVLWCEADQRAAATLVSNFGQGVDEAPVWDDVTTLDGRPWRGVVDIVTAGFPCQPFSQAGLQRGHDDERHLWPHILRVIRECEPEWVMVENVPGILSTLAPDGRPAAIVVRHELEELGYRAEEGLFSAAEVGAPHQRLRWFLVAYADRGRHEQRESGEWGIQEPDSRSPAMGDADQPRPQGRQQPVGERAHQCTPWPPGPEDDAGWREYLRRYPAAAPATQSGLRGDADGLEVGMDVCLCSRRERLRQCGNGVVPMTAALAWMTLAGRLA